MSAVLAAPLPVASPLTPRDPGPLSWKWTREDFIRLYELGFFNGHRVMLIDGEVLAMTPMNRDHANGILYTLQMIQWERFDSIHFSNFGCAAIFNSSG